MYNKAIGYDLGQKRKRGYNICPICGGKLMLVTQSGIWAVDEEPYKNGECAPKGTPDSIETDGIEISGHWCNECYLMVSFHVNLDLPKHDVSFYVKTGNKI